MPSQDNLEAQYKKELQEIKEESKRKEIIEEVFSQEEAQPSERVLKAIAYVINDMSESELKTFLESYEDGSYDRHSAMRNIALYLDQNPEKLIDLETFIEKELSRSQNTNTEIYIPNNTPTLYEDNSMNCVTNTIGDYTYTNCY